MNAWMRVVRRRTRSRCIDFLFEYMGSPAWNFKLHCHSICIYACYDNLLSFVYFVFLKFGQHPALFSDLYQQQHA